MQRRTRFLLAAGAAAMLAIGGLAGLARADMEEGGMSCGMDAGMEGGHHMMGRHMMQRDDGDQDGRLTQAEIDQARRQRLADSDADKSGSLSLEEFRSLWLKAQNERMVREFQFYDRDGDGQVTLAEYQGPLSGLVARRDRNGDGALNGEDRPEQRGHGWRHGFGMGQAMGQGMGHGMMGGAHGPCMGDGMDDHAGSAGTAPPAAAPAAP